ncbi:hypothetical protein G6F65_021660 [Rhizopus arrhizus]|nr:hypothetical protein G6F65_021660 [Rhizopus arrhizus]
MTVGIDAIAALASSSEVVGLDLAVQRLGDLELQLRLPRQGHPLAQRLNVFPDRVEVDLVASHEHEMKALQALVMDALLMPQLLLVQQLGFACTLFFSQFAVVAVEQVFPHRVRRPDELSHHRRVRKPIARHIGHARREILAGYRHPPRQST